MEEANYRQKMFAMIQRGEIPIAPGTVGHVYVFHDTWCVALQEGSGCNCMPEIRYSDHMLEEDEDTPCPP